MYLFIQISTVISQTIETSKQTTVLAVLMLTVSQYDLQGIKKTDVQYSIVLLASKD